MANRGLHSLLVALLSLAVPAAVAAQVAPPRLVVEGEEVAEEAAARAGAAWPLDRDGDRTS